MQSWLAATKRAGSLRVRQGQNDDSQKRRKEKAMTGRKDTIGEKGLRFYSKISASMSHDIKNILAIINENAGLLEDYTLMVNQGVPLDPERLKPLAANIAKQVGRANQITTHMSRVAHSLDQSVSLIDLDETLQRFIELAGRLSQMRNVSMDIRKSSQPVEVETSPFFLMTLIWHLLDRAVAAGEVRSITVAVEKRKDGAHIVFLFEEHARNLREILAAEPVDRLLIFLNAELASESSGEQFSIGLPLRLVAPNP
jgi:signal transduction histidine kinase